ncbi:ester cyclase [Paraburkholderia flagellata]|uniref:ester cyclase n=1 Tax=Paraburkholderia flagellata TaxID=2883241 RepID=UPI003570E450
MSTLYRRYIDVLNRRDWDCLGDFVALDVVHNDRPFGLAGYRAILEQDVREIPDVRFEIELLTAEPPVEVAARMNQSRTRLRGNAVIPACNARALCCASARRPIA